MTTSPSTPTPPAAPAAPLMAVACPACFGALAVGTDLAGLPADCPLCGSGFRVPPLAMPSSTRPVQPPAGTASNATQTHRPAPGREQPSRPRGTVRQEEPAAAASAATLDAVSGMQEPQADSGLAFREPVRTVGSGAGAIVLRQLSPAERAARRTRRNLVMLVGGVSILLTIVLLLGRSR
jgi:hypothetical protein